MIKIQILSSNCRSCENFKNQVLGGIKELLLGMYSRIMALWDVASSYMLKDFKCYSVRNLF